MSLQNMHNLKRNTQVFAGIRKNSHGSGTIALPGGHLEMFESWEECAIREVKEETDLNVHRVVFGHVTNDPMVSEGKHYITIFMTAEVNVLPDQQDHDDALTPKNMEPHKCVGWSSYSWEELLGLNSENKLFGPLEHLVDERPTAILDFFKEGTRSREQNINL